MPNLGRESLPGADLVPRSLGIRTLQPVSRSTCVSSPTAGDLFLGFRESLTLKNRPIRDDFLPPARQPLLNALVFTRAFFIFLS